MHPAARYVVLWVAICTAAAAILLVTSDGEPVCGGPLILDVDDSDPPQCDAPIEGLAAQMPFIAFGAAAATWCVASATELARRMRRSGG